jgi:hypothetical protein
MLAVKFFNYMKNIYVLWDNRKPSMYTCEIHVFVDKSEGKRQVRIYKVIFKIILKRILNK